MFVDEAEILVRAGKGGDGCLSFRREKFAPEGGPDGGDGGDGGSVRAIAVSDADTLMIFSGRHHWLAPNGQPGMGKNKSGRKGEDLILHLPVGTMIHDLDTGCLLKDLCEPQMEVCLAEGGRGGRGNTYFARADHQTPREVELGEPGRERRLRLELKLIADIGLVGLPNAGKSTLLSRLSRARPKIASYPFTTRYPNLGIAELSGDRRLVLADIPGLIEGAHEGAGLGDEFLKHIERTRTILHLVDVGSEMVPYPPVRAYRMIRRELEKYNPALAEKEELICATKVELPGASEAADFLEAEIDRPVMRISAVTGAGLDTLVEALWRLARPAVVEASAWPPAPPGTTLSREQP
jgi:GTP-binding protein